MSNASLPAERVALNFEEIVEQLRTAIRSRTQNYHGEVFFEPHALQRLKQALPHGIAGALVTAPVLESFFAHGLAPRVPPLHQGDDGDQRLVGEGECQ